MNANNREVWEHMWGEGSRIRNQVIGEDGEVIDSNPDAGVPMNQQDIDEVDDLLASLGMERLSTFEEPKESEWV